jgi:uncharacterized membrane protein YkvA (DUF1232 family)
MTEADLLRAQREFEELQGSVTPEDVTRVEASIGKMHKGVLKDVWDQVLLLWTLVKDPAALWGPRSIALAALVYVISPIDAIPDMIPVLGLADDAAIVTIAVTSLAYAVNKYRKEA